MISRLLLAVFVLAVGSVTVLAQQTTPPTRSITVTGTAERQVTPDLATIVVAVETQADTVARAVEQNNTATNKVLTAITQLNIRNLTTRTIGFDVQPIYEQPAPNRPVTTPLRIIGYRVVNRVEVRVPDANATRLSENAGRVIDAVLAAGANRVDNIAFTLENDRPVQNDLLAQATRNARETAAAVASAAGVTLGPLLNLSTTPYYQPPTPLYARAEMATAGVPIVAGPFTYQATVTAVFEIR